MEPRTLAGRYELTQRIGSGGMGTVWRARDVTLGREVAVKVLHEGLASDTAFAERFRREARNAAGLAHPNIVTVYDSGEHEGVPFIVMELVDGESLHARVQRDGPLPVREAVRIARAILGALAHAHARGLVHRDMKPGNVLLAGDGEPKVADFGIAKGLGDGADLTRTGSVLGTAAYLAPEQVWGQEATPASDLYAVGCLMYACLCGAPPFEGDSPVAIAVRHTRDPVPSLRARRPDLPLAIEQVVLRVLEKHPARRFASAAEMDAALAEPASITLPASAPTLVAPPPDATAPLPGTEVLPARRAPPSPAGRVLAVLAVLLLAGAVTWLLTAYLSNRGPGFLQGPLPTEAPAPTPAPTPTPTPTVAPTPAPTGPVLRLPGIDLGSPDEDDFDTPEPDDTPEPGAEETPPVAVPGPFETESPASEGSPSPST